MNILPKKNWHVRSKTNIARVQADEAKAAEEEKKELERIRVAEQEARTNILRRQARNRVSGTSDDSRVANLFGDAKDGKDQNATNKEHELEKREEQEKKEKAIGLLTYLGQSSLDSQNAKPWWSEPPARANSKRSLDRESKELYDEWEIKKKKRLDPVSQINRVTDFLEERNSKRRYDAERPVSQSQQRTLNDKLFHFPDDILRPHSRSKQRDRSVSSSPPDRKKKRKKSKKEKKASKHKKEKRKRESSPVLDVAPSTSVNIETLRNERLQRERAERNRELTILQRRHLEQSGVTPEAEEVIIDERSLPYNSAFNPELSRRPGKRHKTNAEIVAELVK